MNETERIEERAAQWLAQRDRGDWDQQREQELDAWLEASTAHRVAYLRLLAAWQRADRLNALRAPVPPARAVAPRFGLPRYSLHRVAAGVLLAVVLGAVSWLWPGGGEGDRYSTEIGVRGEVSLSDGSRLTLNTNSQVHTAISDRQRTVWLDRGEAYFDVTHEPSRPFVVLAGERRITVLGTRFSVHRHGDQVDVVVEEGRVQIGSNSPAPQAPKPVIATRNDVVVAEAGQILVLAKSAEQVANELSWRQGKLVFDQITLAQAAEEFNRYNRLQLVIAEPALAQLRVGGSFAASNVRGFARLLHDGFGLVVSESADEIKISN